MIETTTYCDICNKKITNVVYAVEVKWINEKNYYRFDLCSECKERGNEFITHKPLVSTDKHKLLGILKSLFNKFS